MAGEKKVESQTKSKAAIEKSTDSIFFFFWKPFQIDCNNQEFSLTKTCQVESCLKRAKKMVGFETEFETREYQELKKLAETGG